MKNMLDEAWGVCYYNTRFVGQAVKTPPSHGGNTGSIPVRTAELSIQCLYRFLRNCCRHWIFVFLIQMFVYLFDIFKQSTNGAIYKPIPYLGDIRLFIAEDTEKIVFHRSEEVINFWRENCIGDVTVIMIPGNHLTCFTDVNNIQKLVNMITEK